MNLKEQGRACGRGWKEEREERNDVIITKETFFTFWSRK